MSSPLVAAVVLAAGHSERMGTVKQLLPVKGEGSQPLLAHVVDQVLGGPFAQVVVVLGWQADRIRQALADRGAPVVVNRGWAEGLSSSVRCGLDALRPEIQAVVFVLADQPGLTARLLRRLVATYVETGAPIVAPAYRGRLGNPVLFDRALFDALRAQTGDKGGRDLLRCYREQVATVPVKDPRDLRDLDTREDYQEWLSGSGRYGGPDTDSAEE